IHPQGVVQEDSSYAHVNAEKKCDVNGTPIYYPKQNHKVNNPEQEHPPCRIEGVLAYQQDHYTEIYWTTSVLQEVKGDGDSKKKIVLMTYNNKETTKQCVPRIETKQVVRADYSKPYQLLYSPGLLEKYTFKAEFDAGVLKSMNTESTPDRGETVKNVATAVKELTESIKNVKGALNLVPDGVEANNVVRCTDEPVLHFIVKTSELCSNGECDHSKYMPK
ncbi:MAG TPA: hypothetical protein PKA39_01350, partial [Ignavibacteria bacterium]|nr:hypothetical protein [Ignavibacteria bacterium]